jgi:uncharacterized repeat protein (TIGR03803 family)
MRRPMFVSKSVLLAVLFLASSVEPGGAASAYPSLITLHSFTGGSDGSNPNGRLIFDKSGAIFGTTGANGTGAVGFGTVFKLTPPAKKGGAWSESVLYSFMGGSDGGYPLAGLIFDSSGALYSTTQGGGAFGLGTVFKLAPPAKKGGAWSESVLYSFMGGSDGEYPGIAGVIFDKSGALYGTTERGGASGALCPDFPDLGCGTVFQLTPPASSGGVWTKSVLHSFTGGDGAVPVSGVIFDKSGALYGTTFSGGAGDNGTVFKLTPPASSGGIWSENVLYSFKGDSDGSTPFYGELVFHTGALYGTTIYGGGSATNCGRPGEGCGTVFKLAPPTSSGGAWSESVLYSFMGGSDGALPVASLLFDKSGALYGVTGNGGAFGFGTVFKLAPPTSSGGAWSERVLHSFTGGSDGAFPLAGLIFDQAGALYGTTTEGGAVGFGTVFKMDISTQEADGSVAGD